MLAFDLAATRNGQFLLRIEDIDRSRSRTQWEDQIYDDLQWLGLHWPQPVMRQSDRLSVYDSALDTLWNQGLLYPCTCNRRDIVAAASAPQEGAPLHGPDGIIYPGTCRKNWNPTNCALQDRPRDIPLRLNIAAAVRLAFGPGDTGSFRETGTGPNDETGDIPFSLENLINTVGDVVLSRRDMGTSYHLSVVLDDAAQGITHVVRGQDLFEVTRIHVLLQILLDLPTPIYHHHRLTRDEAGKRLAKRDDARAISKYRAEGATAADIRAMIKI